MTAEELRNKLWRVQELKLSIDSNWDSKKITYELADRQYSRLEKIELVLISQFKKEVEEKRCKECTFSFIKGGAGYHDVEDFYKE